MRNFLSHTSEILDIELDASLIGDGQHVQYGIGGSTDGRVYADGIFNGLQGDYIAGADVLANEIHDRKS